MRGIHLILKTTYLLIKRFFKKKEKLILDDKINILLSGPSLKNDLGKAEDKLSNILVVNQFVKHEKFKIFKPKYYLIQDPYFWDTSIKNHWEEKRNSTIEGLNKLVSWNMKLIVPDRGKQIQNLISNPKIKIVYFTENILPNKIERYIHRYNKITKYLLLENILSPPRRNILNTSVYVCLLSNVKSINIYGADMSFFKDLEVHQKTNQVGIVEKHFYGDEFFPLYSSKKSKKPSRLSDQLYKWFCVFKDLEKIIQIGYDKGVDIKNLSSKSYIDFIDRD